MKHFLIREDQMEKQAQFTNKKLLFDKNIDFPEFPGVYKFFNIKNEIIYIGKAKNLRNRVKSYLNIRLKNLEMSDCFLSTTGIASFFHPN